jgi:hypothetical protein
MANVEWKSVPQWVTLLRDSNAATREGLASVILENLEGYGFEYGFSMAADVKDLLNAFDALQIVLQEKVKHAWD